MFSIYKRYESKKSNETQTNINCGDYRKKEDACNVAYDISASHFLANADTDENWLVVVVYDKNKNKIAKIYKNAIEVN